MKKRVGFVGTLFVGICLAVISAKPLLAQDPVEVGPHIYTVIFENERVRVSDISFEPGEEIGMHSHPDHFVYVLSAGKLKLSYPDGTTKDFEGVPGQVAWTPAESHAAVNTGESQFHAVVVELKQ